MTVSWSTSKEFKQLNDFRKDEVITKKEYMPLMLEMVAWKIVYYGYMLVVPLMLKPDLSVGFWLICFLSLHFVAGFILATIFQTAHVMPDCDFPEVNEEGTIENNWANVWKQMVLYLVV